MQGLSLREGQIPSAQRLTSVKARWDELGLAQETEPGTVRSCTHTQSTPKQDPLQTLPQLGTTG